MIAITTDVPTEISYSDNSHIFGFLIKVLEGTDTYFEMSRAEAWDRMEEFGNFFGKANIDFHITYPKGN